jgi:hypothetical protein
MQSVQRHFGKFGRRSADETQVSVLLKDFEEADKLLTKVGVTSSVTDRVTDGYGPRSLTLPKHGEKPGSPS